MRSFVSFCAAGLLAAAGFAVSATEAQVLAIQWEGYKGSKAVAAPKVSEVKGPEGGPAVRIEAVAKGNYQGALGKLAEPVDFSKFGALEFSIRHNLGGKNGKASMVLRTSGKAGHNHCNFVVSAKGWSKVVIPLDATSFTAQRGNSVNLLGINEMRIYPFANMNEPGKFLEFADFRLLPRQTDSAALKVMNYTYINEPTSGESGRTLTDGDKTKNVFYRPYSDDPDIIFDLGGRFTVDEIRIHADSAPSHNFSEMTVQLSYDKETWNPAGTIRNTEQGTTPRPVVYTFRTPDKPMVGRYVRFKAARLRSDFMVELSEFEFTGHSPTEAEIAKAAEINYDRGIAMPERSEKDYVRLAKGDFELWISRANGVVNGLFFKGRLLAERLTPKYTLQTRAADTAVDGNQDKVSSIAENPDGSVTVTTTNPALPELVFKRTWSVDGNAVMEKVEVENSMTERKFLRIATEVILEQNFRSSGFYELPGTAIAAGMIRVFAPDVQMDRAATNIPTIAFENDKAGLTLWHTRYRYNGRFTYMDVGTEEENLQYFKPNGWLITAVTIVPADAKVQSIENRFSVTSGRLLQAYDEYIAAPDAAAFRGRIKRPAWLRDLRCGVSQGWDAAYPGSNQRHFANMKDAFSPRGYLVEPEMFDMDGIWGDLPTTGDVYGWFGNRNTPEEVRAKVARMKKQSPNLKVGIYTWFWSAFPWSTPVKNHPEWFVKTLRSGAAASWFPGVNVNYLRFFGIPESRDEARRQIVNFVNYYGQDSWYLDGGKSGVYAKDWDAMRIDDPLGQTDFYWSVREEVKKGHPDRVVFFNHCENPLGDLGYLESFGGTLTSEWRRGAVLMWKFKLYNYKDPLHHSVYVYWLPGVDGAFHNYMSGIGVVGSYLSRNFSTRDLPFIAARYEIRQAQLTDADVKPDWRHDPKEELEIMALRQQNNGWLFLNSHDTGKVEREVSCRTAPLGLTAKDKPVYAWLYTIKNGKTYKALFSEQAVARDYRALGWIAERAAVPRYLGKFPYGERFSYKVPVEPNAAQVLMLSQVPAVILSVAGEPSHYYLAGQPGIELAGDNGKFTVRSEEEAEIGLLLESGQEPASVTVNGKAVAPKVRIEENMRFAVVPVAKGTSEIVMTVKPAAPAAATKLDVARKGRTLKVAVEPADAPVQIYCEGNLVLSRTGSFSLELPETVRDGVYTVKSGGLSKNITLRKLGKPMKLRPILLPVKDEVATEPVNKTIRGIPVLGQGTISAEGIGKGVADPDTLTVTAGTDRVIENHFNRLAAMLEFRAKRYLKVRMHNGFLHFNRFGYQPKRHSVRPARPDVFGGLVLDFGTPEGYTVRSAAGLGTQNEKRTAARPDGWGKKAKQDHLYMLSAILIDDKTEDLECWIDLAKLGAPDNWDGRLCFTLYLEDISPCRSFKIEILETADKLPAGAEALKPQELGAARTALLDIPKVSGKISWGKIPALGELSAAKATMPQLKTVVKGAWDDSNLYFFYQCEEDPAHILNSEGGRINKPWLGDGVEFFVGKSDKPEMIYHVVCDVAGAKFVEESMLVRTPGAKNIEHGSKTAVRVAFRKSPGVWTAVVTIPWSQIGGRPEPGKPVPFNLMRNRLEQGSFGHYTLVPGGVYYSGKQYQFQLKD